jgi:hypothetical protein
LRPGTTLAEATARDALPTRTNPELAVASPQIGDHSLFVARRLFGAS